MPQNQIAEQSIQSLYLIMHSGQHDLATGTGFVVLDTAGQPHLITNWHNVSGRSPYDGQPLSTTGATPDRITIVHHVTHTDQRPGISWQGRSESLYSSDGKPRWFEHPHYKRVVDVVALPLSSLADVELHPYRTLDANEFALGVSERVNIIGFPFGMTAGGTFAVWSAGDIASEPAVNFSDLPLLLVDSRTRQGQSGSPVIMYRNGGAIPMANGDTAMFAGPVSSLLGVYSGRVNRESDLGLVWKKTVIDSILQSKTLGNGSLLDPMSPPNPLSKLYT